MDSHKKNKSKHIPRAKRCLRCAAEFEYNRCTRKYCSTSCRQMEYMQRRKPLQNETQTEVIVIQLKTQKKVGFFKRLINWLWKK